MSSIPETRQSLLLRVRDARDGCSWSEFIDIYAPIVHAFVRKRGLQDADAADLTQSVLLSVAKAIERFSYDPEKGTFRSWLFRITRNELFDYFKSNWHQGRGSGDTQVMNMIGEQPSDSELEAQWEREHQQFMVAWALKKCGDEFQPSTLQAFEMTAFEQEKADDVAEHLGISVGAVYIAKSRVLMRLREVIADVQGDSYRSVVYE